MRVESRLVYARQAYQRALVAARVAPTPRRWRKLLTAARNVRLADRERERKRIAALAPAARALAVVERQPVRRGRVLIPFPGARGGTHWPELIRVWERARALIEQSTRLVAQSRALCVQLRDPCAAHRARADRSAGAGSCGR